MRMLDSSVAGLVAESAEWVASTSKNVLVLRACETSAQDIHTCQRADSGAQVGGGEGTSLEAVDETAACVVGPTRPDPWSSLGYRPCQERDDSEGCAASGSGRNGSWRVPQTSMQCCYMSHFCVWVVWFAEVTCKWLSLAVYSQRYCLVAAACSVWLEALCLSASVSWNIANAVSWKLLHGALPNLQQWCILG